MVTPIYSTCFSHYVIFLNPQDDDVDDDDDDDDSPAYAGIDFPPGMPRLLHLK